MTTYIENKRGQKIYYNYSNSKQENKLLVVFLGGYSSHMEGNKVLMFEEYCQHNDIAFLRLDYSGHGVSEGDFLEGCISDWAHDAIETIEYVATRNDIHRIIIIGSSMGGWLMLHAGLKLKNKLKGLLGIASAPDFTKRLIESQMTEEHNENLDALGKLPMTEPKEEGVEPLYITKKIIQDGRNLLILDKPINLTVPMILIHGVEDQEVPWQLSYDLMAAVKSKQVEVRLIKEGDHILDNFEQLNVLKQGLIDLIKQI